MTIGRVLICRVHLISTFCSPWTSLWSWPSVWWRKTYACLGLFSTLNTHILLLFSLFLENTDYCCFCRFKVSGELPLLHVKISDVMIQGVAELVDSIPFPHLSSTPPSSPNEKVTGHTQGRTHRDTGTLTQMQTYMDTHTHTVIYTMP